MTEFAGEPVRGSHCGNYNGLPVGGSQKIGYTPLWMVNHWAESRNHAASADREAAALEHAPQLAGSTVFTTPKILVSINVRTGSALSGPASIPAKRLALATRRRAAQPHRTRAPTPPRRFVGICGELQWRLRRPAWPRRRPFRSDAQRPAGQPKTVVALVTPARPHAERKRGRAAEPARRARDDTGAGKHNHAMRHAQATTPVYE